MKLITVTCSKRPEMWENVVENICRQGRIPDGVVLVYHKTDADPSSLLTVLEIAIRRPVLSFKLPDHLPLPAAYHKAYAEAAAMCGPGGLLCTMDDDDHYDQGYLGEAERAYLLHPEASLIGKSWYQVHYVDGRFHDEMDGRMDIRPDGQAVSVAGSTMCLPSSLWIDHMPYRLDPEAVWADVDIHERARAFGKIYSTSEFNFTLQRYPPSHGHGWNRPDPERIENENN